MKKLRKKALSMITCLSAAASLALSSCGANNAPPAAETTTSAPAASETADTTTTSAATATEATTTAMTTSAAETAEAGTAAAGNAEDAADASLIGAPWPVSIMGGNITAELPDRNDDLYMYYNYDYLSEHKSENISEMASHRADFASGVLSVLNDESVTYPGIGQLRMFMAQAADTGTLAAQGADELMQYIGRIQNVTSTEEMNALLEAEDFPFNPFIIAFPYLVGREQGNILYLTPNFLYADPIFQGGSLYSDPNDPTNAAMLNVLVNNAMVGLMADLPLIGIEPESVKDISDELLLFESTYGKYADYTQKYLTAEYGAYAEEIKNTIYTLDQLEEMSPAFPIRGVLRNCMKDSSEKYSVPSSEWLHALNELWTDENLETIKLMAIANIFKETRPYRDNSAYNAILEKYGAAGASPDAFAYTACSSLDTFSHLLAEIYTELYLGETAYERLSALTEDLLAAYKELISNTEWLSSNSKAALLDKLDKMEINILKPNSGYYDYSDLRLVPTEEGGTLFGNYLILKKHRQEQELKLLKSSTHVDPSWYIVSPTESNALYDQSVNSINILPGYVTDLMYSDDINKADLLGGIGFTLAHEISHGFDYLGSQLDGAGEPSPVFVDADAERFIEKCTKLADYYSSIEIEPGLNINGDAVKSEAAADLSGMQAILVLAEESDDIDIEEMLRQMAKIWAQVAPETLLYALLADTHPLNYLRVNVSAQMYESVYETFGITEDDGMYLAPEDRIVFWGDVAA